MCPQLEQKFGSEPKSISPQLEHLAGASGVTILLLF